MFGLLRWVLSLCLLVLLVWFTFGVPLGKRTLWGHLHAIFTTQEAKDLADGTREEAENVAERVRRQFRPDAGTTAPDRRAGHPQAPLDPLDDRERKGLDRLVHDKAHAPQKAHR